MSKLLIRFFTYRFTYLYLLIGLLVFNIGIKLIERFWGNHDGLINGHWRFPIFDLNILFGFLFTIACYYKSKATPDIKISHFAWRLLLILAFLLRISLVYWGHNFDLESFEIVGNLVLEGKNFYGFTWRYNYGPVWAYVLGILKFLAGTGPFSLKIFHLYIVFILFLAELAFYKLIYRQYKNKLHVLLLLFNPLSIIIIGHHSQFDILSIGFAYYSYLQLKENKINSAILLLALSFCIKHNMVFLPLVLFLDSTVPLKHRLKYLFFPALIFLASFLPFYPAIQDIKANVFSYQLRYDQTFFKNFLDLILPYFITQLGFLKFLDSSLLYKLIWIASFIGLSYYLNKYAIKDKFLFYLLYLVATSLAISEQYFIIPLAAVFYYRNTIYSWLYLYASTYYICFVSHNNTYPYFNLKSLGLDLEFERTSIDYSLIQVILMAILISAIFKSKNKITTDKVIDGSP